MNRDAIALKYSARETTARVMRSVGAGPPCSSKMPIEREEHYHMKRRANGKFEKDGQKETEGGKKWKLQLCLCIFYVLS